MRTSKIAAVTAVALAAAGGAAVAASGGDEAKKAETAVLQDAAKRLGVEPDALRKALGEAEDAQLDRAVQDGRLTQEQADRLKERRQRSGRVLGLGPHGGPGHRGGGRGFGLGRGPGGPFGDAVAKALGLTEAQLHERLHDGETIAEIAKDRGKDLADVKAAALAAARTRLDAAVKAGRLTDAQRDELVEDLGARFDAIAKGERPAFKRRGFRGGPGGPGLHDGPGGPGLRGGPGGPPPGYGTP